MITNRFAHEILQDIFYTMKYITNFNAGPVESPAGTFTLTGVCGFHHVQIGDDIRIDGKTYIISSYDYAAKEMVITGSDPITVTSFDLADTRPPFFCHGTPIEQSVELTKIKRISAKTPMIFLPEPYKSEFEPDEEFIIGQRCDLKLCFLTQADTDKWVTDDIYKKALSPMKNLMEESLDAIFNSKFVSAADQRASPIYYTKFGFYIQETGTKKLLLAEKLSGIGVDLHIEFDREDLGCNSC